MPLVIQRHHPECAPPKKLVGFWENAGWYPCSAHWMVWFGVTRRTHRLSQLLVYPMYILENVSETHQRPNLVLVRTRYPVPTKSGRSFSLFRIFDYLFFICLYSGARKTQQKMQRFSRSVTKKNTASSVQSPLPSLPGEASSTRNSSCPICDGMELPPAVGGDQVAWTHTIPKETRTTNDTAWPPELILNAFLAYDTWCGMFSGRT